MRAPRQFRRRTTAYVRLFAVRLSFADPAQCCRRQRRHQKAGRFHGESGYTNVPEGVSIRTVTNPKWGSTMVSSHSGYTASHGVVVPLPSSGERYGAEPASAAPYRFFRDNASTASFADPRPSPVSFRALRWRVEPLAKRSAVIPSDCSSGRVPVRLEPAARVSAISNPALHTVGHFKAEQ